MAQGSVSSANSRPHWGEIFTPSSGLPPSSAGVSDLGSNTVMGRWTHTQSNDSLFQLQAFRTSRQRDETTLGNKEKITDVELQYRTALSARHDLVFGGGYRNDDLQTRPTFTLDIPSS